PAGRRAARRRGGGRSGRLSGAQGGPSIESSCGGFPGESGSELGEVKGWSPENTWGVRTKPRPERVEGGCPGEDSPGPVIKVFSGSSRFFERIGGGAEWPAVGSSGRRRAMQPAGSAHLHYPNPKNNPLRAAFMMSARAFSPTIHPEANNLSSRTGPFRLAAVGLISLAASLTAFAQAVSTTTTTTTQTQTSTQPAVAAGPAASSTEQPIVLNEFTVNGSFAGSLEMAAQLKQSSGAIVEVIAP